MSGISGLSERAKDDPYSLDAIDRAYLRLAEMLKPHDIRVLQASVHRRASDRFWAVTVANGQGVYTKNMPVAANENPFGEETIAKLAAVLQAA